MMRKTSSQMRVGTELLSQVLIEANPGFMACSWGRATLCVGFETRNCRSLTKWPDSPH